MICPGISLAQITARLGLVRYWNVIGFFGILYLFAVIATSLRSPFMNALVIIGALSATACTLRLRLKIRHLFSIPGSFIEDILYTIFCSCCSIAQMASHVESYEPGSCQFTPRNTLEGYTNQ
jgi:Cys-rich protein (TIGR01571 family)